MKVLLINGSPRKDGCTHTALSEVADALNANGIETRIYHIGKGPIQGCIACHNCRDSGYCVFKGDGVNECADLLKGADGLIVGSPVYYGAAAGSICSFMDRLFFMKSEPYARKPAAAVVCCRRAGATAALDRLNKYFMLSSMPVVTSQYWNMVHGNTPDEARQDLEGMQVMRTLGGNMAWLLKSIGAAKDVVPLPAREPRVATNFIR
jgi:multimeric flavodoxin WrbA